MVLDKFMGSWTLLKEIPNTRLLVSLNQRRYESANMKIVDISTKMTKEIYSFGEVFGGKKSISEHKSFLEMNKSLFIFITH